VPFKCEVFRVGAGEAAQKWRGFQKDGCIALKDRNPAHLCQSAGFRCVGATLASADHFMMKRQTQFIEVPKTFCTLTEPGLP